MADTKIQIAEVGYYPDHPQGPYRLIQENLDEMIESFTQDVVIDFDHATEYAFLNPGTAKAAGWIKSVSSEDGKLWANVEWNPSGASAIDEREYRYLSPVIDFDQMDWETGYLTGCNLRSVALTNTPAMEGMKPLFNSATLGVYAGVSAQTILNSRGATANAGQSNPSTKTPAKRTQNSMSNERAGFWNRFTKTAKLNTAVADDVDVLAETQHLVSRAETAEAKLAEAHATMATLEAEKAEMAAKIATFEAAQEAATQAAATAQATEIDTILNSAVTDGRIVDASKPDWKSRFEADFEGAKTLLNSIPARGKLPATRVNAPQGRMANSKPSKYVQYAKGE